MKPASPWAFCPLCIEPAEAHCIDGDWFRCDKCNWLMPAARLSLGSVKNELCEPLDEEPEPKGCWNCGAKGDAGPLEPKCKFCDVTLYDSHLKLHWNNRLGVWENEKQIAERERVKTNETLLRKLLSLSRDQRKDLAEQQASQKKREVDEQATARERELTSAKGKRLKQLGKEKKALEKEQRQRAAPKKTETQKAINEARQLPGGCIFSLLIALLVYGIDLENDMLFESMWWLRWLCVFLLSLVVWALVEDTYQSDGQFGVSKTVRAITVLALVLDLALGATSVHFSIKWILLVLFVLPALPDPEPQAPRFTKGDSAHITKLTRRINKLKSQHPCGYCGQFFTEVKEHKDNCREKPWIL